MLVVSKYLCLSQYCDDTSNAGFPNKPLLNCKTNLIPILPDNNLSPIHPHKGIHKPPFPPQHKLIAAYSLPYLITNQYSTAKSVYMPAMPN